LISITQDTINPSISSLWIDVNSHCFTCEFPSRILSEHSFFSTFYWGTRTFHYSSTLSRTLFCSMISQLFSWMLLFVWQISLLSSFLAFLIRTMPMNIAFYAFISLAVVMSTSSFVRGYIISLTEIGNELRKVDLIFFFY